MNEESAIIDAGINYQMSKRPIAIFGDAFSEDARELNRNIAFESGAKWMQKQIDIDIDSIELTGYKRGCKDTIERACNLLTNELKQIEDFCLYNLGIGHRIQEIRKVLEECI